jgi:starvation-inducible outer membrane lipoprotein
MKTFALLLAALSFSLAACSTAPKKDCCSTSGACCAAGKH